MKRRALAPFAGLLYRPALQIGPRVAQITPNWVLSLRSHPAHFEITVHRSSCLRTQLTALAPHCPLAAQVFVVVYACKAVYALSEVWVRRAGFSEEKLAAVLTPSFINGAGW